MHPNVERVQHRLEQAGSAATVVELPEGAPTAARAAEQLGVGVAQIANSLVFLAGEEPVLVLSSGGHRVDTAKLSRLFGAPVRRADPATVRTATGFPIGGVPPVGHARPLPTVVDQTLARHEVLWAAGGTPHTVFATTYDELLRLTGGRAADVAEAP